MFRAILVLSMFITSAPSYGGNHDGYAKYTQYLENKIRKAVGEKSRSKKARETKRREKIKRLLARMKETGNWTELQEISFSELYALSNDTPGLAEAIKEKDKLPRSSLDKLSIEELDAIASSKGYFNLKKAAWLRIHQKCEPLQKKVVALYEPEKDGTVDLDKAVQNLKNLDQKLTYPDLICLYYFGKGLPQLTGPFTRDDPYYQSIQKRDFQMALALHRWEHLKLPPAVYRSVPLQKFLEPYRQAGLSESFPGWTLDSADYLFLYQTFDRFPKKSRYFRTSWFAWELHMETRELDKELRAESHLQSLCLAPFIPSRQELKTMMLQLYELKKEQIAKASGCTIDDTQVENTIRSYRLIIADDLTLRWGRENRLISRALIGDQYDNYIETKIDDLIEQPRFLDFFKRKLLNDNPTIIINNKKTSLQQIVSSCINSLKDDISEAEKSFIAEKVKKHKVEKSIIQNNFDVLVKKLAYSDGSDEDDESDQAEDIEENRKKFELELILVPKKRDAISQFSFLQWLNLDSFESSGDHGHKVYLTDDVPLPTLSAELLQWYATFGGKTPRELRAPGSGRSYGINYTDTTEDFSIVVALFYAASVHGVKMGSRAAMRAALTSAARQGGKRIVQGAALGVLFKTAREIANVLDGKEYDFSVEGYGQAAVGGAIAVPLISVLPKSFSVYLAMHVFEEALVEAEAGNNYSTGVRVGEAYLLCQTPSRVRRGINSRKSQPQKAKSSPKSQPPSVQHPTKTQDQEISILIKAEYPDGRQIVINIGKPISEHGGIIFPGQGPGGGSGSARGAIVVDPPSTGPGGLVAKGGPHVKGQPKYSIEIIVSKPTLPNASGKNTLAQAPKTPPQKKAPSSPKASSKGSPNDKSTKDNLGSPPIRIYPSPQSLGDTPNAKLDPSSDSPDKSANDKVVRIGKVGKILLDPLSPKENFPTKFPPGKSGKQKVEYYWDGTQWVYIDPITFQQYSWDGTKWVFNPFAQSKRLDSEIRIWDPVNKKWNRIPPRLTIPLERLRRRRYYRYGSGMFLTGWIPPKPPVHLVDKIPGDFDQNITNLKEYEENWKSVLSDSNNWRVNLLVDQILEGGPEADTLKALGFAADSERTLQFPTFQKYLENYDRLLKQKGMSERDTLRPGFIYGRINGDTAEFIFLPWNATAPKGFHLYDSKYATPRMFGVMLPKGLFPFSKGRILHDQQHFLGFQLYPDYMKSIRDLDRYYKDPRSKNVSDADKILRFGFFIEAFANVPEQNRKPMMALLGKEFEDVPDEQLTLDKVVQKYSLLSDEQLMREAIELRNAYGKHVQFMGGTARERVGFVDEFLREMLTNFAARLDHGFNVINGIEPRVDARTGLAAFKLAIYYRIGLTPQMYVAAAKLPSGSRLPANNPIHKLFVHSKILEGGPLSVSFGGNRAESLEAQIEIVRIGMEVFDLDYESVRAILRGRGEFEPTMDLGNPAQRNFLFLIRNFQERRALGHGDEVDRRVTEILNRLFPTRPLERIQDVLNVPELNSGPPRLRPQDNSGRNPAEDTNRIVPGQERLEPQTDIPTDSGSRLPKLARIEPQSDVPTNSGSRLPNLARIEPQADVPTNSGSGLPRLARIDPIVDEPTANLADGTRESRPDENFIQTGNPLSDWANQVASEKGYQVLGTLGRGGNGVVALAQKQGHLVAIKNSLGESHVKYLENENKMLRQVKGKNFPEVYEYYSNGEEAILILEYISEAPDSTQPATPLRLILLRQSLGEGVEANQLERYQFDYLMELVVIFESLHDQGVMHLDPKPENIIIAKDRKVLIDFGLATKKGEQPLGDKNETACTPTYVSPEYWSRHWGSEEPASEIMDLFGLQKLLHELVAEGKTVELPHDPILLMVLKTRFKNTKELKHWLLKYRELEKNPTVENESKFLKEYGEFVTRPEYEITGNYKVRETLAWSLWAEREHRFGMHNLKRLFPDENQKEIVEELNAGIERIQLKLSTEQLVRIPLPPPSQLKRNFDGYYNDFSPLHFLRHIEPILDPSLAYEQSDDPLEPLQPLPDGRQNNGNGEDNGPERLQRIQD